MLHDRAPIRSTADAVEVFIARADARACLCREGDLDLHEAVDALQDAAERTGLVDTLGQDAVQDIVAKASDADDAVADVVPDPTPDPVTEATPEIRATESTVDALMFSLCERGAAALAEPASQHRLAEMSTPQIQSIIERLIAARERFPAIDDELLFLIGEQLT
jgi:hypothetical protein